MGIYSILAAQTLQHAGAVSKASNIASAVSNIGGAAGAVGGMLDSPTANNQPVNQTKKILGGALKGAGALSFLGPVGMGIGAVGGGILSAVMGAKEEEDRRNNNALAKFSASKSSKPIPSARASNQYGEQSTYLGEKFGLQDQANEGILSNLQMT